MKHIKGLDVLRAFAVLLVIKAHWGPNKLKSPMLTFIFTKVIPAGTFGVDLFFVLSGYLITNILLTSRDNALPDERSQIVKSFYIRRMLRIFPIYFLTIFIIAYVLGDDYVKNHIIYYLTYTSNFLTFKADAWQGISHTWSLAVEEQFYMVWPWIIIYTPKKYLFKIILFSLFIGVVSTLLLNYQYGEFSSVLLLPCITAFSIGALYAYVINYNQYKKIIVNTFLVLLPISVILLFVYQLGTTLPLVRFINSIIAINMIIYVCNLKYNYVTGFILNNSILINIGKISYGIYLYHYVLPTYSMSFINYLDGQIHFNNKLLRLLTIPPSDYIIHLTILFLISILSYNYLELSFLRLKKYFNYVNKREPNIQTVNSNG